MKPQILQIIANVFSDEKRSLILTNLLSEAVSIYLWFHKFNFILQKIV
jgi:hypothetical protein